MSDNTLIVEDIMNGEQHGRYWRTASAALCHSDRPADQPDERTSRRTAYSFARSDWITLEDTGIRAGEIIAYRAWKLQSDRLVSMYASYVWEPGQTVEGDLKFWGVHAFKTLKKAISEYSCYSYANTVVFGEVALWGEVIEHQEGYRAQYGRVVRLISSRAGTLSPIARFIAWRKVRRLRGIYSR